MNLKREEKDALRSLIGNRIRQLNERIDTCILSAEQADATIARMPRNSCAMYAQERDLLITIHEKLATAENGE